jgi:hypothetical protein
LISFSASFTASSAFAAAFRFPGFFGIFITKQSTNQPVDLPEKQQNESPLVFGMRQFSHPLLSNPSTLYSVAVYIYFPSLKLQKM